MSRLDDDHALGCPVLRGADPDHCGCGDEAQGAPADVDGCSPPWGRQLRGMGMLWSDAGVTDRGDRLALTGLLLQQAPPESTKRLTVGQARIVLARMRAMADAGQLRAWAAEALAARSGS